MKKSFSIILCTIMLFCIISSHSLIVNATTTKTLDQAVAWLDSLVGSRVGSGQCVALIKAYYEFLGAPTPYGNGCDYATNPLPSGWQRIQGATPQAGDILVWTQGLENYGHVAICGGNNKFYHQRWNGYYVEILNKSYTNGFSISSGAYYANYWGVIRPDFNSVSAPSISYSSITPGDYYLRNKANGQYLTVSNGVDAEKQRIHLYEYTATAVQAQAYKIYNVSDGYEIMPFCSTTKVVNPYCWTVESGKTVNLYGKTDENSQWWNFQKIDDAYVIRNAQNQNVCLTNSSADNITVETYTGANSQLWYLDKYCSLSFDANGGSGAPTAQKICQGQSFTIPTENPTKICATFVGWSSAKNSSTASINSGASTTISNDTTFYAVWKDNHNFSAASYTAPKTCKICGATSGDKLKQPTNTTKPNTTDSSTIRPPSTTTTPNSSTSSIVSSVTPSTTIKPNTNTSSAVNSTVTSSTTIQTGTTAGSDVSTATTPSATTQTDAATGSVVSSAPTPSTIIIPNFTTSSAVTSTKSPSTITKPNTTSSTDFSSTSTLSTTATTSSNTNSTVSDETPLDTTSSSISDSTISDPVSTELSGAPKFTWLLLVGGTVIVLIAISVTIVILKRKNQ